jgi:hypothetical protein
MEERRRVSRSRTLKSGKILVRPHTSLVDCTVRNLSSNGALLIVPTLAAIPDRFELILESKRTHHQCRVIWRGENRLGVEFASPISAGNSDAAALSR